MSDVLSRQPSSLQHPALKTRHIFVSLQPQPCILKPGGLCPVSPLCTTAWKLSLGYKLGQTWGSLFPASRLYHSSLPGGHCLKKSLLHIVCLFLFYFIFYFLKFWLFKAAPMAYGSSQARGPIGASAAGLHHSHSHSHAGSEPRL